MTTLATDRRPALTTLTRVEVRKMVDTRAGFWLQVLVAAITVLVAVLVATTGNPSGHSLYDFLGGTVQPGATLLPVVGVLLVTAEWSQRTGLVTFALVPQRSRVMVGKLLAGAVLAVVAFVVAVVLAYLGESFAGSAVPDRWHVTGVQLLQAFVYLLVGMVTGIAFGAAFQSTPLAITMSFVLPIGWTFLTQIHALHGLQTWLDQSTTLDKLTDHTLRGGEWAHVGTSLALWMVLPLVVGWWRVQRADVR